MSWKGQSPPSSDATISDVESTIGIISIREGAQRLSALVVNTGTTSDFADFDVYWQPVSGGGWSDSVPLTSWPVMGYDSGLISLAKTQSDSILVDVRAMSAVKFTAKAVSGGTTSARVKWQVR